MLTLLLLHWKLVCVIATLLLVEIRFHPILGLVVIREREVGIVVKKFGRASLPAGRFVALNGEPGYQADTLSPGWHFGYLPWMYRVAKAPVVVIPQGEIALVVASDGAAIPAGRILGRVVRQLRRAATDADRR